MQKFQKDVSETVTESTLITKVSTIRKEIPGEIHRISEKKNLELSLWKNPWRNKLLKKSREKSLEKPSVKFQEIFIEDSLEEFLRKLQLGIVGRNPSGISEIFLLLFL